MCVCVGGGGGGGGSGGGGGGRFVCYIGWSPASSVYPQKITVYQSYPKNIRYISHTQKISADISIPQKNLFTCFLFIKMWFSFMVVLVI